MSFLKLKIYFRKFFRSFFYILSPIFLIILILIYPFKLIRFGFLPSDRMGEIAIIMEIYLANKFRKVDTPIKAYFDIFIYGDIIANNTYNNLLKTKICVISNIIVFPLYRLVKFLSNYIEFLNRFIISLPFKDKFFSISQTDVQLKVDQKFIDKGNKFLKTLGILPTDKIICLIVRDKAYLNKKYPNRDWKYQDFRDCNIENFRDAINFATEQGYYVFRMGEYVEKHLDLNNKKFIEYSKDHRTDFLDIFLAYRCSFCLSTSTGYDVIPGFTFRKPVLFTNFVPAGDFLSFSNKFIFSIKLHYDSTIKKFLSIKDISEYELSYSFNSKEYIEKNVKLIENTSEEIKKMTEEMIDVVENKSTNSDQETKMQKEFWKVYNKYFDFDHKFNKNLSKIKKKWLLGSKQRVLNGAPISKFSKSFLSKHNFLLNEK